MLIQSIDLQGGQIVQLVQGERLAVATSDVDGRVRKFERFPKIQLIDLDAAKNTGDNRALVASICTRLPEYPSHRECGSAGCLRPSVQIWRMVLSPSNSIAIKPGSVSR